MTFRDDRDALLARADAADAEADRARDEADRLREENERLKRDLARAKDATPAPAREPTPPPARAPHPPPAGFEDEDQVPAGTAQMTPEELAEAALVTGGAEWIGALVIILCVAAGFGVCIKWMGNTWLLFVVIAICLLIGWLLSLVVADVSRGSQRAWLDSLTWVPLPRHAYTTLLGKTRVRRRITLSLWIPAMAAQRRKSVIDHIRSVLPETQAKWDGDRLELKSPTLDTWRSNKYGAAFHNVPVHRWFRRAIELAVQPAVGGLKIERAEISG